MRQRWFLALALLSGMASAGPAVNSWITTADQAQLLAPQPQRRFEPSGAAAPTITVDASQRFQVMAGFGASITDASAWLLRERMTRKQRDGLMRELFGRGEGGLGFSLARLTIGASDFSLTHYSLDDLPPGESDPALVHFSIDANRAELLPVVKQALAINPQLMLMASPWSAPGWMKTSDSLIQGRLKPEAYDAFARYLLRYVNAYAAEGVSIAALTVQNEPHFEPADYPGMRLEPAARAAFIGQHLGPLLARQAKPPQILDWDHNWDVPESPLAVLSDAQARPFVAGVAWHCYGGDVAAQSAVQEAHPDKDTWFTECSSGDWAPSWAEALPWMARQLLIGSTRHGARGVLMWNLALDENHGPHLGGCKDCRGVVTIDSRSGAVTRNVEYYVLGHGSRFVRPGARRIASTPTVGGLETVAFRNEDDGSLVLIVCNTAAEPSSFSVRQGGQSVDYGMPPLSLATLVWTP